MGSLFPKTCLEFLGLSLCSHFGFSDCWYSLFGCPETERKRESWLSWVFDFHGKFGNLGLVGLIGMLRNLVELFEYFSFLGLNWLFHLVVVVEFLGRFYFSVNILLSRERIKGNFFYYKAKIKFVLKSQPKQCHNVWGFWLLLRVEL